MHDADVVGDYDRETISLFVDVHVGYAPDHENVIVLAYEPGAGFLGTPFG